MYCNDCYDDITYHPDIVADKLLKLVEDHPYFYRSGGRYFASEHCGRKDRFTVWITSLIDYNIITKDLVENDKLSEEVVKGYFSRGGGSLFAVYSGSRVAGMFRVAVDRLGYFYIKDIAVVSDSVEVFMGICDFIGGICWLFRDEDVTFTVEVNNSTLKFPWIPINNVSQLLKYFLRDSKLPVAFMTVESGSLSNCNMLVCCGKSGSVDARRGKCLSELLESINKGCSVGLEMFKSLMK